MDQDNDTELSDGISIISDSDCGGRHTPEEPPSEAEKEVHRETKDRSTEAPFVPLTPPDTPLSLVEEEKRLAQVENRLVEREDDVVRGIFGIGRRHVMLIVLLAGISGAMFGHIFRAMPGAPCDCTRLIEPLMNRVYDLEIENARLRDELSKLSQKILSETAGPSVQRPAEAVGNDPTVQGQKVWAGDRDEAVVKPLAEESLCGGGTGDDLFDDYYGKMCREAENRVKEARKMFDKITIEDPATQKSSWESDKGRREPERFPSKERNWDERKGKPGKYPEKDKNFKDDRRGSKEDRRDFKQDRRNSKEDRRDFKEDRKNSKEDRRNSKERFDDRRKKDDDWSGEDYRKRDKYEKMKKGERKNYEDFKDSRERKDGDRRKEKKNGKKWRDDDDSREDRSKEVDAEWHNKRMQGREQFREKESGEKNSNWYLERGSDREIKRLHVDDSHERRR